MFQVVSLTKKIHAFSKIFNHFMASIFSTYLVEHPFAVMTCCKWDVLYITRHQLLAAFLRNL